MPARPTPLSLADLERFDPTAPAGGPQRRFLCPLCGTGKPRDAAHRSLSVEVATGRWCCHRCGAGGLLREWQPPAPSRGRLRTLGGRPGGSGPTSPAPCPGRALDGANPCAVQTAPSRALGTPTGEGGDVSPLAGAGSEGEGSTPPSPAGRGGRGGRSFSEPGAPLAGTPGADYLAGRGIPLAVAEAAGVRFAPDWYGRPAVLFPLRDGAGEAVGFQGRYIDGGAPKMRTGRGATGALFATAGAWEAEPILLCEGPIDALSLAAAGAPAVALLGRSFPAWLPGALASRRVLLAHDADPAGDAAAEALSAALTAAGARPERLRPRGLKDWNDLLLAHGDGTLAAALRASAGCRLPAGWRPECRLPGAECRVPATQPLPSTQHPAAGTDPERLLAQAVRQVGRDVPPAAVCWAGAARPDLIAEALAAEARIQAAAAADDTPAFAAAVAAWQEALARVAAAFTARNGPLLP